MTEQFVVGNSVTVWALDVGLEALESVDANGDPDYTDLTSADTAECKFVDPDGATAATVTANQAGSTNNWNATHTPATAGRWVAEFTIVKSGKTGRKEVEFVVTERRAA